MSLSFLTEELAEHPGPLTVDWKVRSEGSPGSPCGFTADPILLAPLVGVGKPCLTPVDVITGLSLLIPPVSET